MKKIVFFAVLLTLAILAGLTACTTTEKVATAPVKTTVVYNDVDPNDGFINDTEYDILRSDFDEKNIGQMFNREFLVMFGESACRVGSELESLDQLVDEFNRMIVDEAAKNETNYIGGAVMGAMCYDELLRLTANS
jgi:hypothetical protein